MSMHMAGMLALHGIFTLVTRHGLEYPRFYERLYQLLTPAAFQVRASTWSCTPRAPQLRLRCIPLQAVMIMQGDASSELPGLDCQCRRCGRRLGPRPGGNCDSLHACRARPKRGALCRRGSGRASLSWRMCSCRPGWCRRTRLPRLPSALRAWRSLRPRLVRLHLCKLSPPKLNHLHCHAH